MGSGCSPGDCGCLAQAGELAIEPSALIDDISGSIADVRDGLSKGGTRRRSRARPRKPPDEDTPDESAISGESYSRPLRGAGRVRRATRSLLESSEDPDMPSPLPSPWCGMDELWKAGGKLDGKGPVNVLYANNQIYNAVSPPPSTSGACGRRLNPLFVGVPNVPEDLCAQ